MEFHIQDYLTQPQIEVCHRHLALLKKWNEVVNLTAITESKEMWVKHVLDSLVVVPFLPPKGSPLRFLDVGTGGGFPGVPLAIARPDINFVLLDSNSKKIKFLTQTKITLGLTNIFPLHARVEEFRVPEEERFDGIVSRAFASLADMVEKTSPLLLPTGKFYAMKGPEEEPIPAGRTLIHDVPLTVPGLDAIRRLLIF
jgi:16S rRNA (guanine527-N7)-methyltransferase